MKSIIFHLGSQEFPRLRVGIAPGDGERSERNGFSGRTDIIEYVLGDYTVEEKAIIKEVYSKVAEATCCLIVDGIKTAMNKYN